MLFAVLGIIAAALAVFAALTLARGEVAEIGPATGAFIASALPGSLLSRAPERMRAVLGLGPGEEDILPDDLAKSEDPVALTRLGGQILTTNEALRREAGVPGRDVAQLFARLVDCDAPLIYRLSRSAIENGFGLEKVRCRSRDNLFYLSVIRRGTDRMLWRVMPEDKIARAVMPSLSDHYETAPFVYISRGADGLTRSNLLGRELFGADATGALQRLCGPDGEIRPGRYRLSGTDGDERLMRAFVPGGRSREDGSLEVLLFEITPQDESRPELHTGLEELPVALVQIGPDQSIQWLNRAARRVLGPAARPGAGLGTVVESRGRPLESLIAEARAGLGQGRMETVHLAGNDAEQSLEISFSSAGPGPADMLFAVLSDASAIELLQDKYAQSHKMEAVGKLAGGVAHDFNNLITAINGHCDLLLLGKDATQPDYSDLMQIRQNANRAAALVRQLLAFSRKQTLKPELLAISDVISDTLYLLNRLIGDRVTLRLDPEPSGPAGHVRADQRQLEQALMNLVVNARDAMPAGGNVTISTRLRQFRADEERQGSLISAGAYVEIAVADEGMGIEEALIDKVFDPFFTTKAQGEGTGLGLSTVYGIVKQSGGLIFAENRPEGGACFRMLLPRVEPEARAKPMQARQPAPDLTGRGSVLLVEDEAAVRSFAARALRLRGYDVEIAEEAEEALALVSDETRVFDLIVSDVMMPGMDGPTFVERAREIRPDLRVLFVSGYAEEAFQKHIENPDYAFLAKPFSLSELTAKVKEVLSGDGVP
ncbi:MAG: response regulator [Pseudomonadota bacterium]